MTDNRFECEMKLILHGDKNGLRNIYDCYGKLIYQIMVSVVKSPQDAEDLTSDFFLRLWESAENYRFGTGHKSYIATMAKNMAIDFLRKHKREVFGDNENAEVFEQDDGFRTDDHVIGDITFNNALKSLNDEEKEIINLKFGLDLTFKEISRIMQKPLGTVTWKYRQAIKKLEKSVKKEDSIYG